jgi:hypothetical protein
MKKYLVIIGIALFIWTGISVYIYKSQRDTIERLKANEISLMDSYNSYIEVTSKELAKVDKYKHLLDSIKLRPKDVKLIVDTKIEYKTDTVKDFKKEIIYIEDTTTYKYTKKFDCFEVSIISASEPTLLPIEFKDAVITQVVYQKKVRILGIVLWKHNTKTEIRNNCGFKINSEIVNILE